MNDKATPPHTIEGREGGGRGSIELFNPNSCNIPSYFIQENEEKEKYGGKKIMLTNQLCDNQLDNYMIQINIIIQGEGA